MRTFIGAIAAAIMLLLTTSAHAQAVDIEAIADQVESSGSFLEREVTGEASAAIARANANGVAFVRLDNASESPAIAETLLAELQSRNSKYGAVVVLTNAAVFARGKGGSASALTDPITQAFGGGDIAGALDQYLANVGDDAAGGFSDASTTGGDSSGGGFPWIIPILLAIGGFFLFNMMRGRRKTKADEAKTLEEDREEIIEQLKANADRVIDLGDEVIKAGDPELISIYEEASAAYQNVSTGIRDADTIAKVDVLDDQIDKAEWQFEVIEARLTGQAPPPFLDSDRSDKQPDPPPPSPTASPAQRDAQLQRRGQQPRPLPSRNPRYQPQQQKRSSGMGGMIGRMAMSVIMSMLMGGRMGQPRSSRRSQRRQGGSGYGDIKMPF